MHQTTIAADPATFHQQRARFNATRLSPTKPSLHWQEALQDELAWQLAEGRYFEALRQQVIPFISGHAGNTDHLIRRSESLACLGPGPQNALFDWLVLGARCFERYVMELRTTAGTKMTVVTC